MRPVILVLYVLLYTAAKIRGLRAVIVDGVEAGRIKDRSTTDLIHLQWRRCRAAPEA